MPPPPPADFTFDPSLAAYNVPIQDFLSKLNETADPKLEGLMAAGVIFSTHHPAGDPPRVLLVQRASHDSMPDRWEVPGGAVDPGETVMGGLAREVWEESGLAVEGVASEVWAGDLARLPAARGTLIRSTRGRCFLKLTFVVRVRDSAAVALDPDEHQDYVWATEEECRARRVERAAEGRGATELVFTTAEQEETILRAFELRRNGCSL